MTFPRPCQPMGSNKGNHYPESPARLQQSCLPAGPGKGCFTIRSAEDSRGAAGTNGKQKLSTKHGFNICLEVSA